MSQEYYELLSVSASYAFSLLGILVAWRAVSWLRRDSSQRRRVLRTLPDAGYVGALYVMAGQSRGMNPGDSFPLPIEGVLGSRAGCDVRLPHPAVAGRHALFAFQPDGLHVRPYRTERLHVDDQPLPQGCEAILQHGATLALGNVMLQLRLFAGVEVPAAARSDAEPGAQRKKPDAKAALPRSFQSVADEMHGKRRKRARGAPKDGDPS